MGDNYFKNVVGSMRNGVITVDLDGVIQIINGVAMDVLNLGTENLVNRDCEEVLKDYPEIIHMLKGAFTFKHLPDRAEIVIKREGGKSKIIGFSISLIKNDDGQTIGSYFFFKDLTRTEQLREQAKLKDRLAALGQMAAALAHDIRNPLAGIEITAGLLRRKVASEQYKLIDNITSEVENLNNMVNECLEFVKPVELNIKEVEIRAILEECIKLVESFNLSGTVNLKTCFEELPLTFADPAQMKNVFINLIRNACESIQYSGQVTLSLRMINIADNKTSQRNGEACGKAMLVEVKDTGVGIPDGVISKIFNPFFTTKAQGSGIGLSMVQKIVDSHKGRIDVESEEGSGSTFSVYLPILSEKDYMYA